MNSQSLYEKAIKARSVRYLTNCYLMDLIERASEIWTIEDSSLFAYDDHGVNRLIYFAENTTVLDLLLSKIQNGTYFLEIMTKNPEGYIPYGTKVIAKMKRLANSDCRGIFDGGPILQYWDESIGEYAKPGDAKEINQLLWSTFKTEVSHLLSDRELTDVIEQNQVFIHRGEQIDALLQLDVMPKKFYINQVINKGDKKTIHAMMLNQLKRYTDHGGKYIYAWVDDENIASIKFHEKYGMIHDGMWNMVFCLER